MFVIKRQMKWLGKLIKKCSESLVDQALKKRRHNVGVFHF